MPLTTRWWLRSQRARPQSGRRFGEIGWDCGRSIQWQCFSSCAYKCNVDSHGSKKELDEYRNGIVYSSNQLGLGRIAYFNNDLEGAKKHFQAALEATSASGRNWQPGTDANIARQLELVSGTWRFDKGGSRASQVLHRHVKGAQDDKRLDLMWPAQRGLGRSLWMQASQEKDPKKANTTRESAIGNYREAIKTIEALRQGSLRRRSPDNFLATKNVFDEASSSLAEMALIASPTGAALEGNALTYAAEGFKITEQARARSLLRYAQRKRDSSHRRRSG